MGWDRQRGHCELFAGSNSDIIDVPFSTFNPGTYNYTEERGYFGVTAVADPNINCTLDVMEATSEPAAMAFADLGGLALLVSLRRN